MEEIKIREAAAEDAEAMIDYMKIIGGETDNLTFDGAGLPITVEQEKDFLRNVRNDKTSVYLFACKDGEIIGSGSLSGLPRRMSHRAELGIAVKKAYWGRGVGTMLMERLLTYARENGIELINLEVRKDNESAVHLYEKFGFKSIGISPAFFKINDTYIDFELMYLDLRV